jgi:uncharacterized membrane protein (TIGR02234 family)
MVVAGGTLGWSGVRALTGGLVEASAQLPGVGQGPDQVTVEVSSAWPVVAIVAGVLGVAAGVLAVLRGRGWPAMGRRYERAGAPEPVTAARRPETDEDRAQAAWKALDRGEDPTDPASPGDRP